MMVRERAPGLTGEWLNAWLAALGVTVLLPKSRLSWSDEAIPIACFEHDEADSLASLVADAFPTEEELGDLAGASLRRRVALEDFRDVARAARASADASLSSSVSDLLTGRFFKPDDLPHGAFDPPAPRGTTLCSRVASCRKLIGPDLQDRIARTLEGDGERVRANGLGFDVRRIPSGVYPDAHVLVDPVIECLCFVALELFPVRGNGREALQRGWSGRASRRGAFIWPVWSDPLDVWAIDALLDRFHADGLGRVAKRLRVSAAFGSVPFQRRGTSDVSSGYGSERTGVV